MDLGWIKLHRKIQAKGYYKHSQYVHLWVHLLLSANHKPEEFMMNGGIIRLQPGQFFTGRKKLSFDTGIPESSVEDILKLLEKEQQIRQQKTNKYRVITIVNWEQHQISDSTSNNWPTSGQQLADTYKNDKNVRMEEEVTYAAPANEILRIQEHKNGKPFPNRKRQLGAIGRMLAANYSPEDIERCWEWMGRDSFWGEKGFDFENVANQIGKAKAQVADFKSFAKKK